MNRPQEDGSLILEFTEHVPDIMDQLGGNDRFTIKFTTKIMIPFKLMDKPWVVSNKFHGGQMLLIYLYGHQHYFQISNIKYMRIVPNSEHYQRQLAEYEELRGAKAITEGYQSRGWEKADG